MFFLFSSAIFATYLWFYLKAKESNFWSTWAKIRDIPVPGSTHYSRIYYANTLAKCVLNSDLPKIWDKLVSCIPDERVGTLFLSLKKWAQDL
jgi:hypothetical protein